MNTELAQHRSAAGLHGNHEDIKDQVDEECEVAPPTWKPRLMTVEPVLFMYLLAGGLQWPATNAMLYRKVCLSHYDHFTCGNLNNHSYDTEEDVVQGGTSHWFLWHNYMFEVPAILLSFAYGSLSDHVSRRLTITLPVIGAMLSVVNFGINAIFMESHIAYTLIGTGISGMSGGWITLFQACFSYLGEASTPKERTKRVFVAEGVAGFSMAVATSLSGIILDNTSYTFVFSLSIGIYVLCFVYVIVYIREPPKKVHPGEKDKAACMLFLHRSKDALTTVFRRRENNGRARLIVCLMIVFTSMVSFNAMYTVGYLFVKRRPLSWSQTTYGIFVAVNGLVASLTLLLVVPRLRVWLHLRDTALLIIGLTSSCLAEFWFSFCTVTWMVFLMPVLGAFRSTSTVLRSTLSQLVQPYELGKMFAALGALQSLSGMVGSTLFNTIYPHTLRFWPGFCFTLGTVIAFIPASLIWWLYRDLHHGPLFQRLSETELHNAGASDDQNPLLLDADEDELFNDEGNSPNSIHKETVIA